ncbi:MAG: hypothetical protein M3O70_21990 [Actinomycetota bacterium]|nr:hypothetical protein [Actinomycetota bacterium]
MTQGGASPVCPRTRDNVTLVWKAGTLAKDRRAHEVGARQEAEKQLA